MTDHTDAHVDWARQQCQAGTATLAQYETVFAGVPAEGRPRVLAAMPALVEREESGGLVTAHGAVAYPPGVPLPGDIRGALHKLQKTATADPFAWWISPSCQEESALTRALAAHALLVLGDDQAMTLRRRAWELTDHGAVPSGEILHLSAVHTLTVEQADAFLGWEPSLTEVVNGQRRTGDITAVAWLLDSATVTFTALAQIIRLPAHTATGARDIPLGLDRLHLASGMTDPVRYPLPNPTRPGGHIALA